MYPELNHARPSEFQAASESSARGRWQLTAVLLPVLFALLLAACSNTPWSAMEPEDWRLSADRSSILVGPPFLTWWSCREYRAVVVSQNDAEAIVKLEERSKRDCKGPGIAACIDSLDAQTQFSAEDWERCTLRVPLDQPVPADTNVALAPSDR